METIDNYKFITQQNVDDGFFVVTSAEEYEEAQEYNERMYQNRKLRRRFLKEYFGMIAIDTVVIPLLASLSSEKTNWLGIDTSVTTPFTFDSWVLYSLPIALYLFLFIFFVVYKKDYDWRKCLVYTALLIPLNLAYIILVISNCTLMYFFNRLDEEMKTEPNYPYFTRMNLVYRKENKEEIGYDRYKTQEDIEYL